MSLLLTLTGLTLYCASALGYAAAASEQIASPLPDIAQSVAQPPIQISAPTPWLRRESYLVVGNKGEELLDVSTGTDCRTQWRFDHAEIAIHAQRFGSAQLVTQPAPGCQQCEPLVVRWYHEPTGYLAFTVNVYQRQVSAPCPNLSADKEPHS